MPNAVIAWLVATTTLALAGCSSGSGLPDRPVSPWSSITFPDEVGQENWFLPGVPRRRLEPAVAANGTQLVVAGGFSTSFREGLLITDEVISLDTLTGIWEDLPHLPVKVDHAALAASGGVLFLFGGFEDANANARGDSFVLELGATEWTPLDPMPPGLERGAAGIIISPPNILLLGGSNSSGPLASILDFDLGTRTWTRLPVDLPTARSHPAAMKDRDGNLFIAGGLDDANRPLGDVYRLQLGATEWELRDPMTNRGGCAYGVGFGSLFCAGGVAFTSALGVTERYDPILNIWTPQADIPLERAGTQGAMIGGHLYVPGGSQSVMYEPTDTIFIFSVLDGESR